jgi:hypothetical protein
MPSAIALANHTLSGISPAELRQLRNSLELIEARLRKYTHLRLNILTGHFIGKGRVQ